MPLSVHSSSFKFAFMIHSSIVHCFLHASHCFALLHLVVLLFLSFTCSRILYYTTCVHTFWPLPVPPYLPTPWILQVVGMPLNEAVQQLRRPKFFKSINITPLCLMIVPSLADQCTTRFIHFDPRIQILSA